MKTSIPTPITDLARLFRRDSHEISKHAGQITRRLRCDTQRFVRHTRIRLASTGLRAELAARRLGTKFRTHPVPFIVCGCGLAALATLVCWRLRRKD